MFYLYPANTRHRTSASLMLAHHLQRWANIKPALAKGLLRLVRKQ